MRDFNNKITLLKPFPCFCYSIGMLPTSFDASLTYEEQLLFLMNYIKETLIPTVNENGNAVIELQKLYKELEDYVNNYFDNLDVQQEINNKLDIMAEDGTLDKIINQNIFGQINNDIFHLSKNQFIVFPSVNDMKLYNPADAISKLKNNTYVKTISFYENLNKGGATYFITNTNQTVDNIRVFEVNGTSTPLYAVLVDTDNPYCYGAYGDGQHDDTLALQTCINNNRKMTLTPHTVFKISANLNLSENFELNGNWATLNSSSTNNVNNLMSENIRNVTVKNIRLIASNRGICFINCENIKLYNIYISSSNWATLFRLCKNVYANTIYINQMRTTSYSNSDGIHINGLINGHFENVHGSTDDDFLALNADELNANYGDICNVKFINCSTNFNNKLINPDINNSCYRGIRLERLQNNIYNITFENCHITSDNQECILYNGNNVKEINNINFINCSFTQTTSLNKSLIRFEQPFNKIKFASCDFYFYSNTDVSFITILETGKWIQLIDCELHNNDNNRTFLSLNNNLNNIFIDRFKGSLQNTIFILFNNGSHFKLKLNNSSLNNVNGKLLVVKNNSQPSQIMLMNNTFLNFTTFLECHSTLNNLLCEFTNNSPTSSLRNVLFDGVKKPDGSIDPVASIANVRFRGDIYSPTIPTSKITGDNFFLVDIDGNNAYPKFCSHQNWYTYQFEPLNTNVE